MSTCKYCGAEILWIMMKSGKAMPCNTDEFMYKENKHGNMKIVTQSGSVVIAFPCTDRNVADGIGYVSHYATCPGTEKIRRR